MAVLKHFSIKNSPLATLKYIVGETKEHKAAIVTGLKCSEDPESAYMEMAMCYEHFAGEKFHRVGNPTGKEHLKMHHYVISFSGQEVTPQEAHRIAEQWAREIFGDNHQVLIATHTDTKNIHVHLAANAFNMNGKRWLDNKKTLNLCKEKINKLCRLKNLSVIANPKWNANQNYAEWLARKNGTSWKKKLCDDIDRIVLMENVRSIDDLVVQLCNCGYLVRQGKYLSVRPTNLENRKPVRTLKLGDGYGLEELQYRIENKDKEMSLDKVLSYTGVQREYAICLRQIQIGFYRKENFFVNVTYNELRRSAELLCYIHEHNIHSKEDFEKHVNEIAEKTAQAAERVKETKEKIKEKEFILENGDRYLELLHREGPLYPSMLKDLEPYEILSENKIRSKEDIQKVSQELKLLKSQLPAFEREYEKAAVDKKAVTAHYSTFIRQTETDYERCLRSGKKELEEYEASLSKPPKKEFIDRIVLMENVKTIDHLVMQLCNCGYLVRKGKYLCVKPENFGKRQGVRTLKLGDGYGLEELQYRIENKDKEMSLDKVLSYTGVQREYAICLRQIQIGFYRKENFFVNVTYNELRRSAELLCYIHEHNIHSKEDFEKHVNSIAKKSDELVERRKAIEAKIKELEYIVENGDKYIEMIGLYHKTGIAKYYDEYKKMKPCIENQISTREDVDNAAAELEKLRSELADMQGEYESAISAKKAVTAHYTTFIRQMETDYERCLRSGKKELEEYEANLSKPPKKQFSEVVEQMADWADKALEKVAEKERAEEQQRAEARKKRSGYCR